MSIIQTIRLQKQPIIPTLKEYILSSHFSKTDGLVKSRGEIFGNIILKGAI